MSSARREPLLRSGVARRILATHIACLVVLLALIWSVFAIYRWHTLAGVRASVAELSEDLIAQYQAEGSESVIGEIRFDGQPIWSPDLLYGILEEDLHILRFMTPADETLAGLDIIDPGGGWSRTVVDFEDLSGHPVISLRTLLDGETHELVVAKFVPDRLFVLGEWLRLTSWLLVLATLPIGVIAAYVTGRSVRHRLSVISSTVEQVGDGDLDARIRTDGYGDEFDQLSLVVNDMLDRISALTTNLEGVSVGVAHDLKTPVSNLAGRLQLLERDAADPQAVSAHVAAAEKHISTLLRTLNALLRLGEVEAGKRRGAFTAMDLSELVEDMAGSFQPLFEDADKRLEVRIVPGMSVNGDRDLLTQMISNLLENALEHARDGANAWIGLRTERNRALLEVGDDGPGLPANAADSVFERFVRLDYSRSTPGNGLGLSLVRAIAELHNGTARVVATEPGAVFEISLPLRGD